MRYATIQYVNWVCLIQAVVGKMVLIHGFEGPTTLGPKRGGAKRDAMCLFSPKVASLWLPNNYVAKKHVLKGSSFLLNVILCF